MHAWVSADGTRVSCNIIYRPYSSGGARGGAIAPGRQREGVPKEGGKRVVPAKGGRQV
jgi:hypothetical protein